jgi:hypothetical protein
MGNGRDIYFYVICSGPAWLVMARSPYMFPKDYQLSNVLTARAQAFLIDYTRRTGHKPPREPSLGWCMLTTANAADTNGLTCLPKHERSRDSKFLITHLTTDQRCLTLTAGVGPPRHNIGKIRLIMKIKIYMEFTITKKPSH